MSKTSTTRKKTGTKSFFEHKNKPLLPLKTFYKRQVQFFLYALLLLVLSLGIGMTGYMLIAGLDWIQSFQNSAMILAGMGEIDKMPDEKSKIFSGCYALFSGVVFLSTVAVMFSPLVHRLLHIMHLESSAEE